MRRRCRSVARCPREIRRDRGTSTANARWRVDRDHQFRRPLLVVWRVSAAHEDADNRDGRTSFRGTFRLAGFDIRSVKLEQRSTYARGTLNTDTANLLSDARRWSRQLERIDALSRQLSRS